MLRCDWSRVYSKTGIRFGMEYCACVHGFSIKFMSLKSILSKSKKLIEITGFNFPRMMQVIPWTEVLRREFCD